MKNLPNFLSSQFLVLLTLLIFLTSHLPNFYLYAASNPPVYGIAVGSGPTDIAINPDTNIAVVTTQTGAAIVDLDAKSVIADLSVYEPQYVAIDKGLNLALVTGIDNSVSVIDLGSLSVISNTPFNQTISGIAVNTANHTALILAIDPITYASSVIIWDIQSLNIVTSIPLMSAGKAVSVDPELNLSVVVGEKNISVIDLNSNQIVQHLTSGINKIAVSINPDTHVAAIADKGNDTVTILNLTSWQSVSIPAATHPVNVAMNRLDNRALVISIPNQSRKSTTSPVLQVIDLNTNSIVQSYTLNQLPTGVAVNNFTNIAGVIDDQTNSLNLIQLPNPVPVVNSISPDTLLRGSSNQTIAINGSGFIKSSSVSLLNPNSYSLTPIFIDNNNIQAPAPDSILSGTGSYQLTVTNPSTNQFDGGTSKPQGLNVVNPVPSITALLPLNAIAGSLSLELDIFGSGFFNDTSFYINNQQRAFTYDSYTKAEIPLSSSDIANGGYLNINAFNPAPGGGYSNQAVFTVLNPVPALSLLNPAETGVNSSLTLTLTGSGFVSASSVQFNGQSIPFTYQSQTGIQVNISAAMIQSAGYYPVEVINPAPGGGTSNSADFNVLKADTSISMSSSLNPSMPGQSVTFTATITSSAGTPTGTVEFFDGTVSLGTDVLENSTASIDVSALALGSHKIIAVYNGDNNFNGSQTSVLTQTVDNPPSISADYFVSMKNAVLSIGAPGVLGNDGSVSLTAFKASDPAHGMLTLNPDGSFTYTPEADFTGIDTFTYKASDGIMDSDPAAVTINVLEEGSGPVAINDAYSATANTGLSVDPSHGVLNNDTGSSLTAVKISDPAHGTLILNPDGSFTYMPEADFTGVDAFTYKANNGIDSNIAMVAISVLSQESNPAANNDDFDADENTDLTINAPGVLANDTGSSLTPFLVMAPLYGSLTLNEDGSFIYTPETGFSGTDTFIYRASDGSVFSNVAMATIKVKPAPSIYVQAASGVYGGTTNLSATLTSGGSPLNEKSISFSLNGRSAGTAVTDENGIAALSGVGLSGISAGAYPSYITASFEGDSDYAKTSATGQLAVTKAAPAITWNNPADITYGTALGEAQLNATSSITGTFVYSPPAGTILNAGGSQTLSVTFTPSDSTDYTSAEKDVLINVLNPAPALSQLNPAETGINSPITLTLTGSGFVSASSVQFNGQSIPFTYQSQTGIQVNISAAMVPSAGNYPLEVINPAPGGGTSNTLNLTVKNPVPVLSSSSQTTISPNTSASLTLTGSNFLSGSVASLDGNNLSTAFMDSNDLNIVIPATLANEGTHNITVTNPGPGGGVSNQLVLTIQSSLPPDPVTVAPPVDNTVATTMLSSTQFLYIGPNAVQTGVVPGTMQASFAAVIRGNVFNRDGSPLSGVTITILNHPEFGSTLSRSDGAFDMAVNGGDTLTVKYDKYGYLPVHKQVNVPWQDYVKAPDAVLIQPDSAATSIDLASTAAIQVARANPVTDDSGTRQATLLFNQGTTATMVMPDGTTRPISSLTVRATEFTVGPNGPAAMPGILTPNVAYTYAIDYSADEAISAGAKTVRFSQPVFSYTDNFLHFYVGAIAPSAYYDRDRGVWIPSDNGLVIGILSITNGIANLDVDGNGIPATSQELTNLGITTAELQQLASMYQPGQSFWRVPISHFSIWDINMGLVPPPGATPPNQPPPFGGPPPPLPPHPCNNPCGCGNNSSGGDSSAPGCIIGIQHQSLGESVNIAGTPFSLNYRSSTQPGRLESYSLTIPLSSTSVPTPLKSIELEVNVAGQTFTQSFDPVPNQSYTYAWNGKDAYGRQVLGGQPITTQIGYVYDGTYVSMIPNPVSESYDNVFGHFSYFGSAITDDRTRQSVTLWQINQSTTSGLSAAGHWNAQAQGLGGWTLSIQHAYDPVGRVLYMGTGSQRSVNRMNNVIATIAGGLKNPSGVAADGKGNIYIADQYNNVIKKVDTSGNITIVAGTGSAGFGGDGGPAVNSELYNPSGVSADNAGNIYIADQSNNRIRKIDVNGIITTVAGSGQTGYRGDGGLATQAALNGPSGVATDSSGNIFISDSYNNRLRMVDPGGVIVTVAGNGQAGYNGDGVQGQQAALNMPTGVAVDRYGNIYIADRKNNCIRKVDIGGAISTVAGSGQNCAWTGCDVADSGPAVQANLDSPTGVAVDGSGNLFIADMYHSRIRIVNPTGTIATVAGTGMPSYIGDNGAASQAGLKYPAGVAVDPVGNLYIADTGNNRVRAIKPVLPGVSTQDIQIPSEDGSEVYVFDSSGRHLKTQDALTGATIYSFSYQESGYLSSVTDRDGNITTINRDGSGNITSIIAPGGQRTTFGLDSNGYLSSATNPAGNVTSFSYTNGGLMTSETDPKGNSHSYSYDSMGRLITDKDPAGSTQTISRSDTTAGYTVSLTTGMGLTSTYEVETTPLGTTTMTDVDPAGRQTVTTEDAFGTGTTNYPDGTVVNKVMGPDPRFGMQAPVTTAMTTKTPGGLQYSLSESRSLSPSSSSSTSSIFSFTSLTDSLNLNGNMFTSVYDSASKTITATSAMGRQSFTTLNNQGKVIGHQVSGILPISYGYDSLGRLNSIAQGSRFYSFNYDSQNRISSIIDPMNRSIGFGYDQAGRVIQETLPDGRLVNYSYDANGNVTAIVPPGKPSHNFDYTPVDLMQDYIPPSLGFNGTTSYAYDLDRRLTEEDQPTGSSFTQITDNTENTAFTYDGSLLTSSTWSGVINGTVSFTYNNDFNIAAETLNGTNSVSYVYDNDGLLTGAGALALTRDTQNGIVIGSTLGGVSDSLTYNEFGEVSGYNASYGSSTLLNVQYTRDALGRITQKTETTNSATDVYGYTYDLAGRLIDVSKNSANISHYDYDSNGNRASYNNSVIGTYNAQDRLISYGAYSFTYTANGDLASKTGANGTTQYGYDNFGNLAVVVQPDGTRIEYVVDGQNRRVGKKVNGTLVQGFLYENQLRPIAELDGNGNVVSQFVYGTKINVPDYMIKGENAYRIITDHLGSPRLIVDISSGQIVQRMDYDEFGNVTQDTNPGFQPFGYAGGLYDRDTGLVRFGARDYDPLTGTWRSKDPILFAGGNANLYGYVNDPVNFMDPLGLIWVTVGYKYPAMRDYLHYLWNRFWQDFNKEITKENLSNLTRDVIQEWQHDSNCPSRDKEYPIGARRIITQKYIQYLREPDDLTNDPNADFYYQWTPWVDSPTYDNYPNTKYENIFYWQQGH